MRSLHDSRTEPKVYILHENKEWILPLIDGLEKLGTPYEEWFLNRGNLDIDKEPPNGVFYNRISASSHTRGNRYAIEMTGPVISWLEAFDRQVINGRRAIQLEVRKIEQYISLRQFGIKIPKTLTAVGKSEIKKAAYELNLFPFILKPNRGGKGLDVRLFHTVESLSEFLDNSVLDEISLDGVFLIQEYIKPKDNRIVRMEFINGKFTYAVAVDTSDGFELCPADSCQIGDSACPASNSDKNKFEIIKDFNIPEIESCEAFLKANKIDIAGMEFVEDQSGHRYFYDVNTNTNYNRKAEIRSGSDIYGMDQIAQYLTDELEKQSRDKSLKHQSIRTPETILV